MARRPHRSDRRRTGGRGQGAANERCRRDRFRRVSRGARALRLRRLARVVLARLVRCTWNAGQAQLLHRPAWPEGLRREDLHCRRRPRSAGAAQGVRLRGNPQAARATRGSRRRAQRRLGPDNGGTGRRRCRVDRTRAARRIARLGPTPLGALRVARRRRIGRRSSPIWSATGFTSHACTTSVSCIRARESSPA